MYYRRRARRTWLPMALAAAGLLSVIIIGGCPPAEQAQNDDADDPAQIEADADELLSEIERRMPDPNAVPTYTVAGAEGPPGALFGVGMGNTTIGWVLGDMYADSLQITGVALTRASGGMILQQDIREDGTRFTLPAGDTLDIAENGDGLRITMQLEATDPPSVIVADVDANGELTINEAESIVYLTATADYDPLRIKPYGPNPLAEKALTWEPDQGWCTYLGNELEWILGKGCEAYTLVTGKAPTIAIDRLCVATSNFMDGFQSPDDPVNFRRAVAGMKITMLAMCELTKAGWSVARFFKGLSPWELACHVFTLVSNASVSYDGRTLADRACGLWGVGPDGVGAGGSSGDGDPGGGDDDPNDSSDPGGTGGDTIPLIGSLEYVYYENRYSETGDYSETYYIGDDDFNPQNAELQVYAQGGTMYIDWDAGAIDWRGREVNVERVSVYDGDPSILCAGEVLWSADVAAGADEIQPPVRYGDCARGDLVCDDAPLPLDPPCGDQLDVYITWSVDWGGGISKQYLAAANVRIIE